MKDYHNIAALQSDVLDFDKSKLEYYLTLVKAKNCKLLVLGEYVANDFFKQYEGKSLAFIKDQSNFQKALFKRLAKTYNIHIVVPLMLVEKKQIKKVFVKFTPKSSSNYEQQILINYNHWQEEQFFANAKKPLTKPLIFTISNIRYAILAGFELHFEYFWQELSRSKVDVVLLPTCSSFNSMQRWRKVIVARSFLHHVYILRVNRIGFYENSDGQQWHFYGDSLLSNPAGEIEMSLGDEEELMIAHIDQSHAKTLRKLWGFSDILDQRLNL